jgi:3-carboxy-cis,cis-muconate cycloisomerase
VSFSPIDSPLYASLFRDARLEEPFSDAGALRRMIRVLAALARVQGRLGVIPASVADSIDEGLQESTLERLDLGRLAERVARDGVPVAGLVEQLREALRAAEREAAADHLHWGATTQDVMDTALALQLREALDVIGGSLDVAIDALLAVAERHRDTPMVARTHGRQALPTTFGAKAAGWLAPLLRHRQRLRELRPRLLLVQLGGAAGTLAPLGDAALDVRRGLAEELELGLPPMPWHVQRDGVAELAGWLAASSASVAKMAGDLIAMNQDEIGEVRLGAAADAGGSSTLPHKRNPIQAEMIVVAARANASLIGAVYQGMLQEHERGTHGWQLEWMALPQMVALTSSALQRAGRVIVSLQVDAGRMREHLDDTHGMVLAERLTFALAEHSSRPAAAALVKQAAGRVVREGGTLVDAVRRACDLPLDWEALGEPSTATGAAGAFVDAVLREAAAGVGTEEER